MHIRCLVWTNRKLPKSVIQSLPADSEKKIYICVTDVNSPDLAAFQELINYKKNQHLYAFEEVNPIEPYTGHAKKEDITETDHIVENIVTLKSVVIVLPLALWLEANETGNFTNIVADHWTLGLFVMDVGTGQRFIATSDKISCMDESISTVLTSLKYAFST